MNLKIYTIICIIIINIIIIIDLYPLWLDYKLRYFQKKSHISNSSLDHNFIYLDNLMEQSNDFEGHIGCSELKKKFIDNILNTYKISNMCEIGFNAGHSAALFLNHSSNIKYMLSFDICSHKYSKNCINYIKFLYKERFNIICGDSKDTVPNYKGIRFDLIFIDGSHFNNMPFIDIKNTIKYLAKPGSLILMDDIHYSHLISFFFNHTVDKAWNKYINLNIIKPISSIKGLSLGYVV